MNVLPLPSERHPRRASDGCASIGQYRSIDRDGDCGSSSAVPSSTQIKSIQQEHQALQVRPILIALLCHLQLNFVALFSFMILIMMMLMIN